MSNTGGVRRFFSKRDQHHGKRHGTSTQRSTSAEPLRQVSASSSTLPVDFYGLFDGGYKRANNQEDQNVTTIRKRLQDRKGVLVKDAQILWALHSSFSKGEVVEAFSLLLAMLDARDGLVRNYDPRITLRGAENRHAVTCYLDSTLFAIFSRLDSFEAMLYNAFEDKTITKLGIVLRLWVNLLRSGKLITTDITEVITNTLAEAGWEDAANIHQQDASEAFTFIAGKLELPMLTLKMDIYHTGREDEKDDHKYINERLLEVAVPASPDGEHHTTTLEECLEDYFNNRIEVRRYLERRPTVDSMRALEKSGAIHVETIEIENDSSCSTPLSASPSHTVTLRPAARTRTQSIVQERYFPDLSDRTIVSPTMGDVKGPVGRLRQGSMRKEIMMPAWQFFSLIPWYTDQRPSNDAQVAAHFSSKRPVLGLCLKRYSFDAQGRAHRVNTHIDIPIEIGLPHFIQDDHMNEENAPLFGNFKLSLQSVVCHRGKSVDSGHYIALSRATPSSSLVDNDSLWMRFDDLASQRITLVDIEKALKDEMPYLLFYQIVPIDGNSAQIKAEEKPPSYAVSEAHDSGVSGVSSTPPELQIPNEDGNPSGRLSLDTTSSINLRGRSPVLEASRPSIAFADAPETGLGVLPAGTEETMSLAPSGTSSSPSRGEGILYSGRQSKSAEGISRTLSKLTKKRNDEVLPTTASEAQIAQMLPLEGTTNRPGSRQSVEITTKGRKRQKSRNRLSKGADGKATDGKPDRECLVM